MYNFTTSSIFGNPRNLSAAIYAPVFVDGKVAGLLGAERHHARPNTDIEFPPWGVDLLAALARMVSMSMEKHVLLSALEHTRDEVAATQKLLNQKEEFLLLMAHDLKNPLTAIRGLAQVLRRRISRASHAQPDTGQDTHDLISGLESIEQQTRKIEHMINALVEVSRIDLDRLELELQAVDLVQLTRRALREYRTLAPKHELSLSVNGTPVSLDEDATTTFPAVFVLADRLRLEYILVNLVSNAVKYSPGGGPVRASIQVLRDQYVEFTIEDQGIGIPHNEQALITERFYRGEYARQNGIQGFGLGLYLVHILVSKHRGTFTVKSEGMPGKGSLFAFTLPPQ